jgi:hypothetical protein
MRKLSVIFGIAAAIIWLTFFFAFELGRAKCLPLLSSKCLGQGWQIFGDIILLMWVERWQTLITGLLAIVAAFIGGWFINRQVAEAKTQEGERLRRRHFSARAMAPLALSTLTEYTLGVAEALGNIHGQAVGGGIPHTAVIPTFPSLPTDVLSSFRDMVETSNEGVAGAFADILSDVQIQRARIRSLVSDIPRHTVLSLNIEQYLIDAASIHAQASALFSYARREVDGAPDAITWNAVRSSLRQMGIWEEDYDSLFELISSREARDAKP